MGPKIQIQPQVKKEKIHKTVKNLEPFSTPIAEFFELSGLQLLHFPPVSDWSNDVRILSSETMAGKTR